MWSEEALLAAPAEEPPAAARIRLSSLSLRWNVSVPVTSVASMRQMLQSLANRAGYRIEKIRGQMPGPYIRIAALVFAALNKLRDGDVRFIQVGAHDGQHQDPLYDWICRNPWRGILVEPQPRFFEKLTALHASRPNITVERAVVAARSGKTKFWTLGDAPDLPLDATLFASLDRDQVERNARLYMPDFVDRLVAIDVDAYTFSDLMSKHHFDALDLLQIDAEGYDFEIIKMIDFTKCLPRVINYEHTNLSVDQRRACRSYLAGFGYSFASTDLGDTVACLDEVIAALC